MKRMKPETPATKAIEPGVCRICGCTEDNACVIPSPRFGERSRVCGWADDAHTLCDAPACLAADRAQKQRSMDTIFVRDRAKHDGRRIKVLRKRAALTVTKQEREAMAARRAQFQRREGGAA